MFEEIVDNLAYVFNETGADMAYFDAGEEWSKIRLLAERR